MRKLRLQSLLTLPFIAQLIVAVGIIALVSLWHGQQAVNDLAAQLRREVTVRVSERMQHYLMDPHQVNELNALALSSAALDLSNQAARDQHFVGVLSLFPQVANSYIGLENGFEYGANRRDDGGFRVFETDPQIGAGLVYHQYDLAQARQEYLKTIPDYDPRTRPWYQTAVTAQKPTWTHVFYSATGRGLVMTATHPVYTPDRELVGVFGCSFLLSWINDYLAGLRIGKTGQLFVMDRNGLLVATSTANKYATIHFVNDKGERLNALDSPNSLIRRATLTIISQQSDLNQIKSEQYLNFDYEGDKQLLQVTPFQDDYGIDWLIVTLIPESDFMDEIVASTRRTFVIMGLALLVAIILGFLTTRQVIRPISQLNQSATQLATGDWTQRAESGAIVELNQLAASFNRMADELHAAFETLEDRVEVRTQELAEARDKAEAANRAKSAFLANMSHELRTPLNAVMGFAQIMVHDDNLTDEQRENLDVIHRSGQHLLMLISDVLDLAKIEAGRFDLEMTAVNLSKVVKSVSDMIEMQAKQKGVRFTVDIEDDLPQMIQTDQKRLRQILLNLLGNAVKFTTAGRVSLRLSTRAQQLIYEIEDTGVGIPAAEMKTIFDPFVQVKNPASLTEGTGLGLAITHHLVEKLGGSIDVTSTVDVGTTFTVILPLISISQHPTPAETGGTDRQITGYHGPRRTVLIVDDVPTNRLLLRKLLEGVGFTTLEAANGYDALDIVRNQPLDLILLDLVMPEMDGATFIERLRFSPAYNDIRVIVLTASAQEQSRLESVKAGADDFLTKPVQIDPLFYGIQKQLHLEWVYCD